MAEPRMGTGIGRHDEGKKLAQRRQWRKQQAAFKEVSQWPSPEWGRALADTTRARSGRNELTTDKDAGRTIPYRVVVLLISASYELETNSDSAVSIKS